MHMLYRFLPTIHPSVRYTCRRTVKSCRLQDLSLVTTQGPLSKQLDQYREAKETHLQTSLKVVFFNLLEGVNRKYLNASTQPTLFTGLERVINC